MFVDPRSSPKRSRCARLCRCRRTASPHLPLLPAHLRRVVVAPLVVALLPLVLRVLPLLAVLAAAAVPVKVDWLTKLLVLPLVLPVLCGEVAVLCG